MLTYMMYMKSYFLPIVISMLCFCGSVSAQTKIAYAYDANGNLIKRSNNSILKSRSLQNLHEDNQKTYGDNEISIIEESLSGKYSIKTRDYIDGNKAVVRIYSEGGAIVLNKRFGGSGTDVDISNQADGIYIMQIQINDNYKSQWKLPKKGAR